MIVACDGSCKFYSMYYFEEWISRWKAHSLDQSAHTDEKVDWNVRQTAFLFDDNMFNPLGPRPPVTARSFALLRNPRPPGSGWLADAPY